MNLVGMGRLKATQFHLTCGKCGEKKKNSVTLIKGYLETKLPNN